MSIEGIIYMAGIVSLFSFLLLVTVFAATASAILITRHLCKELRSTYNHIQLAYFMKMLKEKGYATTKEEFFSEKTWRKDYE